MAWDEYAALTRHLGAVRRAAADQQSAASHQRATAQERAARLDGRLAAQRDRLSRLAALIGASPRDLLAPVAPAVDAVLRPPPTGETPATEAQTAVSPSPEPPALTTTPHVPAQRTGPPPVLATPPHGHPPHGHPPHGHPAHGPAVTGDPWAMLDAAERYADAADLSAAHAEAAAMRPGLLPGATPLTRSFAVYAACAGLALVVQMGLVLLAGNSGGYSWSIGAWMCTGLPALAFFAGFGALTVWGRPAVGDGRPAERHPRIGFAICFLALPIALCGYFALVTVIRG